MLTFRKVKTSTKDFYEIRDGETRLRKFKSWVGIGDIVILFHTNDVVNIYTLEAGHGISPNDYSQTADLARKMLAVTDKSTLLCMGQLWISKVGRVLHIGNVGLGPYDGNFTFNQQGIDALGLNGLKLLSVQRKLTRVLKEETKTWENSK